jgi:outer membrane protein assembly factor BamB
MKVCFLLCLLMLSSGCAWLGDRDNSAPPAKLEAFEETTRLKKIWSHDTGKGTNDQLLKLVPAIADGIVYVADHNGRVVALNADNGKKIWKTNTDVLLSAGPGIGGQLVLVGTSNGDLIALGADDGAVRWHIAVTSEILAVPKVHLGVVIIQTVDGNLSGYDSESGKRLWIFDRTVPVLTLRGTSSPLIIDDIVMAGFANGKLVALDIRSGRQLWEATVAVPSGRSELERLVDIDADLVMHKGILYVISFQGHLAAVDLEDGAVLWNRELSSFSGLSVDNTQVYVTDDISQVWALSNNNGQSMWKQDGLLHRAVTGPVRFDDFVVVGDFAGYVHLFNAADGQPAGRVRVDRAGVQLMPVVDGQRLYVLGAGGKLVAYELRKPAS